MQPYSVEQQHPAYAPTAPAYGVQPPPVMVAPQYVPTAPAYAVQPPQGIAAPPYVVSHPNAFAPPGFQVNPAPSQNNNVIVVNQPTPGVQVTEGVCLRNMPVQLKCPSCQTVCFTTTNKSLSMKGWIWVLILFIFTGCLCYIPLMMNSCKETKHKCSNCKALVGTFKN
uniref:lipopolysaccharide-induced tumor necrosis factor-alpha factor-like isoform X2 n=1 Tax=Myxine glutinosa TaxID=7769 RepID=UPI00358F1746